MSPTEPHNQSGTQPQSGSQQELFPIRTVAQLTGVNPITLRAWERRYNLIRPVRTPAGHRLYSHRDIQRIQRILELADQGMGMGQIAVMLQREGQHPPKAAPATTTQPKAPAASARRPAGGDAWASRLEQAIIGLDGMAVSRIEHEALGWLAPADYLETLLLPLVEQLESRQGWPDREIALAWFNDYLLARLRWVMGQSPRTDDHRPVITMDLLDTLRPFTAEECRLALALADSHRVQLLPKTLTERQRRRLNERWHARMWIRLIHARQHLTRQRPRRPMIGTTLIQYCTPSRQPAAATAEPSERLIGDADFCRERILARLAEASETGPPH